MIERLTIWLAWHLPRRLLYWAYIRAIAQVTTGPYRDRTPDDVTLLEALRALEKETP